jgi:hypothetical protein
MTDVVKASLDDAPFLADLNSNGYNAVGMTQFTIEDAREALVAWVRGLIDADKLWVIRDENGPVMLGHYDLPLF